MGAVKAAEARTGAKKTAVKVGTKESAKVAAKTVGKRMENPQVAPPKSSPQPVMAERPVARSPAIGQRLLTEAEVINSREEDYMSSAQLAFFRDRLQSMERDILRNAGETTEHLRETIIVPDPADRATIEEEHALELRTRDRERKLLKKIQQSIVRIDSGDYGYCEETGEPIGVLRLLARPTATLSLEAQERREMKQKLYGD